MWDTIQELWEEWFDRLNWVGVGVIVVTVAVMLYTHQEEVGAVTPKQSTYTAAAINKLDPGRSPEIENMLRQTVELWDKKDYAGTLEKTKQMLALDPREPFAYLYQARARREMKDMGQSIVAYSKAIKLNPDFVDKRSKDFLGRSKYYPKELKPYVDQAVSYSQTQEFRQRPDVEAIQKEIYYLQRRLAGGCE